MKANIYFIVLLFAITLSSCSSSLLDEKIDLSNLLEMASKIRTENPNLELAKNEVLTRLELITKGRDAVQSYTSDELVGEEKFDMYKEQLFNFFLSRGTTYKQLFDEVEVMNAFDAQFEPKLQNIYRQIDAFCVEKQNEIEDKESQVQRMIAELSKTINVNIISINQRGTVDVLAQISNETKAPIEAIDFNLYILKGGTVIAKLPIHMDDRFVSNKIKKFSYSKKNSPSIFNSLKNINVNSITIKEEVYKMNHDGNVRDAYAITRGLTNHQYKTTEMLNGSCPYLTAKDALSVELDQILKNKEVELAEVTPCLEKIEYIRQMILNK